jgi:multisubunit Na+/H+ antiporter MnhF subunit
VFEYLFLAAGIISLIRAVIGRTFADRVISVGAFVNMAILLMVFHATSTGETMIMDIALLMTLLSFVGTLAIAKYLIPKERI